MTSEEHRALADLAKQMRTDKSGAMRAVLAIGVKLLVKAMKEGTVVAVVVEEEPAAARKGKE